MRRIPCGWMAVALLAGGSCYAQTAFDVVLVSQSVDRDIVQNMKEAGVRLELV